jgi:hypothetical protein
MAAFSAVGRRVGPLRKARYAACACSELERLRRHGVPVPDVQVPEDKAASGIMLGREVDIRLVQAVATGLPGLDLSGVIVRLICHW